MLTRESGESETLESLYHSSFQNLLTYLTENLAPKMELLECNYITQVRLQTVTVGEIVIAGVGKF